MEYLNGNIYHMIHFNNLESIFRRQALLSKEKVVQEKISYHSIANDDVQGLRDRIFVWDAVRHKLKSLHSYVPFYIANRTPMLLVQCAQGIQDQIVIFEVSRTIIQERGTIFTNGNASNQQLSRSGSEIASITPRTKKEEQCVRKYYPNGPCGTNPNCSDFYASPIFLEELNWLIINGRFFSGREQSRVKQAEVLVPDMLPLSKVKAIAVNNQIMIKEVNKLLHQYKLANQIPFAILNKKLFF